MMTMCPVLGPGLWSGLARLDLPALVKAVGRADFFFCCWWLPEGRKRNPTNLHALYTLLYSTQYTHHNSTLINKKKNYTHIDYS